MEVKKTQKRANALQNIQIPRFKELIKNIDEVLEEKEREDFFRLKVVKKKKHR
jgi:V/A-type H+-transporting ATPase subunit D